MSGTLPPGILPNVTNTDPPAIHPDTVVGDGFTGAIPVNDAVPYITYDGTTATCTHGEWFGEPTTYSWQWQLGGTNVGTDLPTYTATGAGTLTCLVTASNEYGSTTAPVSNAVAIATPVLRAAAPASAQAPTATAHG